MTPHTDCRIIHHSPVTTCTSSILVYISIIQSPHRGEKEQCAESRNAPQELLLSTQQRRLACSAPSHHHMPFPVTLGARLQSWMGRPLA
mmetsp:Transcript_26241/g.52607  ORF Transcript_26241/g.52607 Transcript_26241/m.52607 type:complete len:89 (-) Transcript_26241:772-1038(-)